MVSNSSLKNLEEKSKDSGMYRSLINGLAEMRREGVDIVVLSLYESEPSKNVTSQWLSGEEIRYYPFEMLSDDEQNMILEGKHYTRVALVRNNVGGIIEYNSDGVEIFCRTHLHLYLPQLTRESELNYVTRGGAWTGDKLKEFAEYVEKSGWTEELIKERIGEGLEEYHAKTIELMKKEVVYKSLEVMEQRKSTPFEQMLANMRTQIEQAKINNNSH